MTPRPRPAKKRRRLPDQQDTVLSTVRFPRPLHHRLRLASVHLNWTFGELVRSAAEEWLAKHEAQVVTRRPS